MIRVLIVDDSAFMRKVLSDVFAKDSDFQVIDTARNGNDAVDKVMKLSPDVITLDVEMPELDGLSALERIMELRPTPVVMVSSLTKAGGEKTVRALELGAVDFIAKTAGTISSVEDIAAELIRKCRAASRVNMARLPQVRRIDATVVAPAPRQIFKPIQLPSSAVDGIVAIGTSTGGPRALQEVLTRLPGDLPYPTVIVQHMPAGFTKSLAERLNMICPLSVKEAEDGDILAPMNVYIAPGNYHMTIRRESGRAYIKLNQEAAIGGLRPAVDPMMYSVAEHFGTKVVGVILTGMGHDGAKGIQAIKKAHGCTIAEDQSTAVIFGMPKSAIDLGVIDNILPLNDVADGIVRCLRNLGGGIR